MSLRPNEFHQIIVKMREVLDQAKAAQDAEIIQLLQDTITVLYQVAEQRIDQGFYEGGQG